LDFRYLAVEGPLGLGKTALAEHLAARLDSWAVLEQKVNSFVGF
jgi:deoxyadenosine/deoxycytidine kinase